MSTYVIVDDIDPTIQYSAMLDPSSSHNGGWSHGSGVRLNPFNPSSSVTYSAEPGLPESLTFEFSGSQISVISKIPINTDINNATTNVNFSIDSTVVYSTTCVTNNQWQTHVPIFTSDRLSEGNHTLEISISPEHEDSSDIAGSSFQLDYLIYEAAVNSTITNSTTSWVFVDDSNPFISYSVGDWSTPGTTVWVPSTSLTLDAVTLNRTLTASTAPGATMYLEFTGTAIEAYGMVPYALSDNLDAVLSYSIDGRAPSNVSIPSSTKSFPLYNWLFIQESGSTGTDPDESHRLEITVFEANTFYLDYIVVSSPKAFVAQSLPTHSSTTTSSSSSSHSTAVSTPSSSVDQAKSSSSRVGKIVGPVVAAVAVLVGMAFVIIFLRRRRSRAARSDPTDPLMSVRRRRQHNSAQITPFTSFYDSDVSYTDRTPQRFGKGFGQEMTQSFDSQGLTPTPTTSSSLRDIRATRRQPDDTQTFVGSMFTAAPPPSYHAY